MRLCRWLFAICLLLAWPSHGVATLGVRYNGRLVDGSGAPRQGPLTFEAKFFRSVSGGAAVGPTQSFSDVALADGVFELALTFSVSEFHALFADDQSVWIELRDVTHGVTLPRQRLEAAPYARKVPVDGATLSFDGDGKLTVGTIAASQVTGLSAALGDKVDTSDFTTQLAGKADAAATTAALADKADAAATTAALAGKAAVTHTHTLGGDVSGDVGTTVVTKLRGSPIGTAAPSSVGQVLKWDGSKWAPGPDDGGASGVITNGASLGGGEELFKDVSAPDMRFRTLTAGANASVTTVGDTIAIATTPGLTTSAQGGVVLGPYDVNAGETGELRFQELAAGGSNYVGFKAPDALASDVTYTLPATAPASDGQLLSSTTTGGLSWVTLPGSLPPSGSAGGDLTGSYPNPDISANAITAAEIAANAVDTSELNDNAVTTAKLAAGAVTTAKLAAGAVTGAELAADAVTSAKIAADTIAAADIAADAVTASEIAAGAVGSSELAPDAVTSAKIQDGQVQTADLAANAVTTAEIADGTIANADIAASAAIARSKLAAGTGSHVLINDGSGAVSSEAQLAASRGGTGVNSTATFPTSGVVVTRDAAETLTNKTLTSPTINGGTMTSALGTAGAPSYAFNGDADTGVWSSGADTWNVSTAGAERIRVAATGNVGIGTTSPDVPLHVVTPASLGGAFVSTAALGSTSGSGVISYVYDLPDAADERLGYFLLGSKGGGANAYHGAGVAGFSAGAWTAGSSYPSYLTFETASAGSTSRSERMRITSTGNVGIGTTSPAYSLDIASGAAQFANALRVIPSTHATSRRAAMLLDDWQIGQDLAGDGTKDFYIYENTGAATRLTISTAGKVGIGTSTPAAMLHIGGISGADGLMFPDGSMQRTAPIVTPSHSGFRLTTESGIPVSVNERVAQSTLYMTPYKDDIIALFTSSAWHYRQTPEISLALTGLTASKNYDIFAYWSGAAVVLELGEAWSNNTARAENLTRLNGVWVKASDWTRRLVGTIRSSSSTTLEDTTGRRFLWNASNRVTRKLKAVDTTDNWVYTTDAWRASRGDTTDGVSRVAYVVGLDEEIVSAHVSRMVHNSSASVRISVGIGIDSTTVNSADLNNGAAYPAPGFVPSLAEYRGNIGAGYHYIQALERSQALGTSVFFGDDTASSGWLQGGLIAEVAQ